MFRTKITDRMFGMPIDSSDYVFRLIFRLDALAKALSVIATGTWLGGWVAGWLGVRHTPVLYQNG